MPAASNSRLLNAAMQKPGVVCELLELPNGDHGLNGYQGPGWDAWQTDSLAWLNRIVPANP